MTSSSKISGGGDISNGATLLMLGTILSQGLVLLSAPVMTRLFSPEQFGVFGVYVAIFAFFNITTSLRYELAIPLPRTQTFALNIMVLCFMLTMLTVILAFLLAYFWGQKTFELLGVSFHEAIIWVLPCGLLFGGAYKSLTFWAFRNNAFKDVAGARVLQGAGLSASQVLLGLASVGSVGLMMGHAIGFMCAAIGLALLISRIAVDQWRSVSISRICSAATRYRKFPIFSSWSDLINVIGSQFPTLFVAAVFSPIEAGFYLLANRVANAPVAVIAEATSKSLMAAAAKNRGKPELVGISRNVFKLLLRTGLGPMAMIALIAPELTSIVFGDEWVDTGTYLRLLVLWTLSVYLFVPLMSLYTVLELQKQELVFQVLIFSARIGGLIIGSIVGTIQDALLFFSIAAALSYTASGIWILRKVGVSFRALIYDMLSEIGLAAMQIGCISLVGLGVSFAGFLETSELAVLEIAMVTAIGLGIFLNARYRLRSI